MNPFIRFIRPLWFFQPGANTATSVDVNVTLACNLTVSVGNFDREIDLTGLAFNLSADVFQDAEGEPHLIQAGIDLDDITHDAPTLQLSVTPIYSLSQSGQIDTCVSAAYKLTCSVTATIFPDVVPTLTYKMSASISAVLLIANNIDVAVAYNLTASTAMALDIQPGQHDVDVLVSYGMSCAIDADIDLGRTGGLVYSIKKEKYIPVLVGFPLTSA